MGYKMVGCGGARSYAPLTYLLTSVLEYSFHIEAIGSTCFIVRTPFEIIGQLSRPTVVYHPWVALIDCILRSNKYERDLLNVSVLGHLRIIIVDGVEGGLIF